MLPGPAARRAPSTADVLLTARREHALQGDVEVEGQVRLHVVVRLVAACGGESRIGHRNQWRTGGRQVRSRSDHTGIGIALRSRTVTRCSLCHQSMGMRGNLGLEETYRL